MHCSDLRRRTSASARPILALAFLLLTWAAWPLHALGQEIGWEPSKTWVMAVGVLQWKASNLYHEFPKTSRRDVELVKFFRDRGVPESQIVFLEDQHATRSHIEHAFVDLLKKTKPGDLLVFYYAGHGVREDGTTCFANYDITGETLKTGWQIPAIFDMIERHFHGSRVLLAADACYSGGLGVEAKKHHGKIAYGVLTSVQPNSTSTRNWTFTESLLKGLRGDSMVDLNGDGQVQLDELARYTEKEMAFAEGQKSWFSTANGFDPEMPLAQAKQVKDRGAGRRVEAHWQEKWWPAYALQTSNGKTHVHYAGFGAEWDEWLGPERIRQYQPKHLAVGTPVEVEWQEKWWPAKVVESSLGLQLIRYDGFGKEWDEWVGPRRIRSRN
jgi:hypothetical protein